MEPAGLRIRHNIEVAHRLSLLTGKCEAIHGHSMNVELTLKGPLDDQGLMAGLEFGQLKKVFRDHLDTQYDHRLLLNRADPLLHGVKGFRPQLVYPGLQTVPGDPTTENIAKWIAKWAQLEWDDSAVESFFVQVDETAVNSATYFCGR